MYRKLTNKQLFPAPEVIPVTGSFTTLVAVGEQIALPVSACGAKRSSLAHPSAALMATGSVTEGEIGRRQASRAGAETQTIS